MLNKWNTVDTMVKTKVKQSLLPVLGAQVCCRLHIIVF